jgi:ABC-type amino acid transport substrate-binding protein
MQYHYTKKLVITSIVLVLMWTNSFAEISSRKLVLGNLENSLNAKPAKRVLDMAYKRIGIDVDVIYYPAERALIIANQGSVDGELQRVYGINKKFPNLIMVPTSIGQFASYVFTKKVEFVVDGWKSLGPYHIGLVKGVKFAERATQGMKRSFAMTVPQLFRMLYAERVDIVVISEFSGLIGLKKAGLEGIKYLTPPVEVYKLYHYLHKKNKDLVPEIDLVLKDMEKEGMIKKIWDQFRETIK